MRIKIIYFLLPVVFLVTGCPNIDHQHHHNAQTWKIVFYRDETDKTSNFSQYYFMFNSDGKLMAHKGMSTYAGTWSETTTRFVINFGNDPVLSQLNADWLKIEESNSILKLKDDNPTQDDELYFMKE